MKLEIASQEMEKAWDKFARGHNNSHPFYLWKYGEIIENTFGIKIQRNCLVEGGEIVGLFPLYKRRSGLTITTPYSDYGGPIAANDNIQSFLKLMPETDYSFFSQVELIKNSSHKFAYFELDTRERYETIHKERMNRKTRNMINKADRCDFEISYDKKNLKEYYGVYLDTMRRLTAMPLPSSFFFALSEVFENEAKYFFASKNGKLLAGIIAIEFEGVLYFWSNSSDREMSHLPANYAVYKEAIMYGCENEKINKINFGCSSINTSHAKFKERIGGIEKPIFSYSSSEQYVGAGSKIVSLACRLPRPILDRVALLAHRTY